MFGDVWRECKNQNFRAYIFLKSPFSTSHSHGNLVDGLPRRVSWILQGGAFIGKNDILGLMFWVVCDIHVFGNFLKPCEGH